jgi:hypothetical protein
VRADCDQCDEEADVHLCNDHALTTAAERVREWLTAELLKPGTRMAQETVDTINRMAEDLEVS